MEIKRKVLLVNLYTRGYQSKRDIFSSLDSEFVPTIIHYSVNQTLQKH